MPKLEVIITGNLTGNYIHPKQIQREIRGCAIVVHFNEALENYASFRFKSSA